MKPLKKKVFSGIQSKVFCLILLAILFLSAAFIVISLYKNDMLSHRISINGEKQQETVSEFTGKVMNQVVKEGLEDANWTNAQFVDKMFASAKERVSFLTDCLRIVLESPEGYEPHPYTVPDPATDGSWTPKMIFAADTDENDPVLAVKLGLIANLSDTMISLCKAFEMSDIYIGLPEGVLFTVSDHSSHWFVDGKLRDYDPRTRIWYQQAAEAGELIFTNGEWDANTDDYCVECAMPVYDAKGGLQAVVGMDLYLDEMEQVMNKSVSEGEYILLVNHDGKAVLPTQTEIFPMASEDRERTLWESRNETLAQAVCNVLEGNSTDVALGQLVDGNYYIITTPIPTTGWALISAFSQEVAQLPKNLLQEHLSAVQTESIAAYNEERVSLQRKAIMLFTAVVLLMLGGAIIVGRRIVKPLNMISQRLIRRGF